MTQRVLLEAIEGGGIAHWARVEDWDGERSATVVEPGGVRHRLDLEHAGAAVAEFLSRNPEFDPLDVDGDLADEIVQLSLFGSVVYLERHRAEPPSEK
ncbi:hypothetical protein G419_22759 [Rhodococcus triatomae BKS 15-14]|nr:hypothetical protein G419_22759 [Rhodococcus triatomae BKS 15-14]